jgi:hypothetical protein
MLIVVVVVAAIVGIVLVALVADGVEARFCALYLLRIRFLVILSPWPPPPRSI